MEIKLEQTVKFKDEVIEFNKDGVSYIMEFDGDLLEYLNICNDYGTRDDYEGSVRFDSDVIEYIANNMSKAELRDN